VWVVVISCNSCGSKVESPRCCKKSMGLEGKTLKCSSCKKTVEVNRCCGSHMKDADEIEAEEADNDPEEASE